MNVKTIKCHDTTKSSISKFWRFEGMYEMEWVCKKGKGYVRNEKGIWEMERVCKKWKWNVRNGKGM